MIPIAQTKLPPAKSANKFTGGRLRLQNYYCDHSDDGSDDDDSEGGDCDYDGCDEDE